MNTTNAQTQNPTDNTVNYFDFHSSGVAYLNRARWVTPKKGKPFLAVTCAVLNGKSDDVDYKWVDCTIRGDQATQMVESLLDTINATGDDNKPIHKVLAVVTIGDIYPETYTPNKGKNAGKVCATLKGRLINVANVKIDGELQQSSVPQSSVVTFGHDCWPVTEQVCLVGSDPVSQNQQHQLLTSYGYLPYKEGSLWYVLSDSDEARQGLFARQSALNPDNQQQPSAVNE